MPIRQGAAGSRIDSVCFDLDGTLLRDDRMAEIVEAVVAGLVERHPRLSVDEVRQSNRRYWERTWQEHEVAWCRGESSLNQVSTRIWTATLTDLGVEDPQGVAEACLLQERLERESWQLYEESAEVIDGLRERGIRIGVITNGPSDFQRAKLEAVGLAQAFDTVVVSADRGIEKPRPEIFELALATLGTDPARALHVGDSRTADVAGARTAGMTAVWLDRSGRGTLPPGQHADAVVTDLRGLYPLLR
jgi:putative hydrolase of the HAD superfamily